MSLDRHRTSPFREVTHSADRFPALGSAVFLLISMGACAKIGDPLPPLVRVPQTQEFQLVQQALDGVELILSSLPEDLREIRVYRQCGSSSSPISKDDLLARVKPQDLVTHPDPGKLMFQDPNPVFDRPCRYAIRVANRQGRLSPFSEVKDTITLLPPGPPDSLEVETYENRVVVSWDAPSMNSEEPERLKAVGYLVNSRHFVSEPMFIDRDFVFEKPSSYQVQTVGRRVNPTILSTFSPILTIIPRDAFPPRVPQNVTAVSLGAKVQLLWDANGEPDLDGYFVYRGSGGSKLERLTPLMSNSRYVDEKPPAGTALHYAVSAVDTWGNESLLSKQVLVTLQP